MNEKLDDLGWPEAKIFDLTFDGETLKFSMTDLLSYGDPLKFEIVNVSISEVKALQIEVSPYDGDKYLDREVVVSFGKVTEQDECFEGIIEECNLTKTKAKYFWISSDVNAKSINVERTGKYVYIQRVG